MREEAIDKKEKAGVIARLFPTMKFRICAIRVLEFDLENELQSQLNRARTARTEHRVGAGDVRRLVAESETRAGCSPKDR